MKTIIFITLFFNSLLFSKENIRTVNLLVHQNGFPELRTKDARIAIDIWVDHFKGNNLKTELSFFRNLDKALNAYKNKEYEFFGLNIVDYLENRKTLDKTTHSYIAALYKKDLFNSYVIIANKKSKINTIADLKNKKVSILSQFQMGKLFLDSELLKLKGNISDNFIETIIKTKKHSTSIMNTFFRKTDVAVIPEYKLKLMQEMNPSLMKKIKVIKKSKAIFLSTIALVQDTKDTEAKKLAHTLVELLNSQMGRNILNIFKVKALKSVEKNELKEIKLYYDEYKKLLSNYNDKNSKS